ncbi:MAG: hypothetical protein WBB07_29270 [Mycobacterium sp.]
MRSTKNRIRVLAAAAAAAAVLVSGCSPAEQTGAPDATSTSSTTVPTLPAFTTTAPPSTSAAPQPVDYGALLLSASDISDQEDTFAQRSSTPDANGQPGASAFFVNAEDTRAITDTIVGYPTAAEATEALKLVLADPTKVVVGGSTRPMAVGTDGTVIKGTSPDGEKAVTLLVFTQDRALVRLKFESATGDATSDSFVTSIGKMQQIALRTGLVDPE